MKKVTIFFTVTVILLSTVAVFAGKGKFTMGTIYAFNGTTYCQLTGSTSLLNLSTIGTGCTQAKITDCNGNSWSLYLWNGISYSALYFPGC